MAKTETLRLAHMSVRGAVQGVGFRPLVYRLAIKHNSKGWVCNTSKDVKIEVEGKTEAVKQFQFSLYSALARICLCKGFGDISKKK